MQLTRDLVPIAPEVDKIKISLQKLSHVTYIFATIDDDT